MGHTQQQWEDRVRAWLGDLGVYQLIDPTQIPFAVQAAFTEFSTDHPREFIDTLTGDGSAYDFTLNDAGDAQDAWIPGWSRLVEVEYPAGERNREIPELRRFEVLRGTSTFRMILDTPSATQTAKITYTTLWPAPSDTAADDEVAGVYFDAVAALAASKVAMAKAVEMARRKSSSVAGELFRAEPESLFGAAKQLAGEYRNVVLGQGPDGGTADDLGYAVERVDVLPEALFHRH